MARKKRSSLFRHQLLELLAQGLPLGEIAAKLNRSVGTVRQTLYLMRQSAEARSTVQLVVMYREDALPKNFRI